jgi:hypothetical protein
MSRKKTHVPDNPVNIEDFTEEVVVEEQQTPEIPKEKPKRVDNNAYFLLESKYGDKTITMPVRGYQLKSWLNFVKSLNVEHAYREVTEPEYLEHHWTHPKWNIK